MSKTIYLTFNNTPKVLVGDSITVKIDNTGSVLNLGENFKSERSSLYEVKVPLTYTPNQMAFNFAFAWNLDYKIQNIDPNSKGDVYAEVTENVVSITVNDDSWSFPNPIGTAVDSGAISFYIPVVNEVLIQGYSESDVNPCYFVDIDFLVNGGVAPYDVYVDKVLTLEDQNAIFTLNTSRGLGKGVSVFDSNNNVVHKVRTKDTSQTTNIQVEITQNGSNADVTITNDAVSDITYTYSLDGAIYQSSNVFTSVSSGSKIAYIKDSLGCVQTKSFEIGSNLLYFFEFTDIKLIKHRCEIYNSEFFGTPTEIQGNLSLSKSSTKDTLDPIRGGGLSLNLEANVNLTFEDFYSENERVFSVKYIRNGVDLFLGWLSPEGLYQSYVDDKWLINLDCTDGLGFLKNLSYVENDTGLPYIGKQSVLEVIVNCLKRTNLKQNIYSFIDVVYDTQTRNTNTLSETFINANRFIKEDENTFMNCDEVLRSLYDLFGLCITQYQGSWVIYKPNVLKNSSSLDYYAYDSDGVALSPTKKNINAGFVLGSQINGFYPHHVNKNQQLSIDSAIGAYRINYQYGLVKAFTFNDYLVSDGTTIDEYTILDNTYLNINSNNRGFKIDTISSISDVLILDSTINLIAGDKFNFKSVVLSDYVNSFARYTIKLVGTSNTYYLKNKELLNGDKNNREFLAEWVTSYNEMKLGSFTYDNVFQEATANIITEGLPEDGSIEFKILTSGNSTFSPRGAVEVIEIVFSPINAESDLKGENHNFQFNTVNKSTKIENVKEVFNGDYPSDIYIGTIYKSDETTPTELWNRGNVRKISLLQYSGEERMAMYSKPLRVFTGDIFGYVDYLSVISIDGIDDVKFMPIEYSYNAIDNITTVKLKQILNDAGGVSYSNINYDVSLDYGNVVEPTIK